MKGVILVDKILYICGGKFSKSLVDKIWEIFKLHPYFSFYLRPVAPVQGRICTKFQLNISTRCGDIGGGSFSIRAYAASDALMSLQ